MPDGSIAIAAHDSCFRERQIRRKDKVVSLFAKYQEAERAQSRASQAHSALREVLIERHGDRIGRPHADAAWKADPTYSEFERAFHDSDRFCNKSTELLEFLMQTPTLSLAGARCKVLAALDMLRHRELLGDDMEFTDVLSLAFLRDAEHFLWRELA